MAVDHLECQCQRPLAAPAAATRCPSRPCCRRSCHARPRNAGKRRGCRLRPSSRNSASNRRGDSKVSVSALHVHHRLGETCAHQHVSPVVHVREFVGRRAASPCDRYKLAQLAQGIGSQAGEHQESVDRQHPVPLASSAFGSADICSAMLAHTMSDAAIGRSAEAGRGAQPARRAATTACASADCVAACPRGRRVHDPAWRVAVTLRHRRMGLHAAAQRLPIDPAPGLHADPLQTLLHAPPDLLMQPGRCRLRAPRPSAPRRVDQWWEEDRRTWGAGVGQRIYWPDVSRPAPEHIRPHAEPVRGVPQLAVGAGLRSLCRAIRAAVRALPHLRRTVVTGDVAQCGDCVRSPPPLDACVAALALRLSLVGPDRPVQVPRPPRMGGRLRRADAQLALGGAGAGAGHRGHPDAVVGPAPARARLQSGARTGAPAGPGQDRCRAAAAHPRQPATKRAQARTSGCATCTMPLPSNRCACGETGRRAGRADRRRDDQRRLAVHAAARRCARPAPPTSPASCWRAPNGSATPAIERRVASASMHARQADRPVARQSAPCFTSCWSNPKFRPIPAT